jgi:LysM repeat protein
VITLVLVVGLLVVAMATMVTTAQTGCSHTVRSGDTLFSIARTYGVTVAEIVAANGLSDPNRILPGQVLTIPAEGCDATGTPDPEATDEADEADDGDDGWDIPEGWQLYFAPYTVQPGDTFSKLAEMFNVPVEDILRANGFDEDSLLIPGEIIYIPQYIDPDRRFVRGGRSGSGTPQPISNCGPPNHQINCYPESGGDFWDYDSVDDEPIVTTWRPCLPEEVMTSSGWACSKTGLGFFQVTPGTPVPAATTPAPTPEITPIPDAQAPA